MSNLPLVYAMNPHCKTVTLTVLPVPGASPDGDRSNGLPPHEKNGAKRRSSEMVPCSIPVPCSICEQNPPRCITLSVHRSRKRVTPRFPLPDAPRIPRHVKGQGLAGATHVPQDPRQHGPCQGLTALALDGVGHCGRREQTEALPEPVHFLRQSKTLHPPTMNTRSSRSVTEPHDKSRMTKTPPQSQRFIISVAMPQSWCVNPSVMPRFWWMPPTDPACTLLPPLLSESRCPHSCPPPTLPALLYRPSCRSPEPCSKWLEDTVNRNSQVLSRSKALKAMHVAEAFKCVRITDLPVAFGASGREKERHGYSRPGRSGSALCRAG